MRALLALSLLGCGESMPPGQTFDHNAIFEVRERSTVYGDVPFLMEVPTLFRTQDVLPSTAVNALAIHEGEIYAGTEGGLVKMPLDGAAFVEVNGATEPIVDLAVGADLYAAARDRVYAAGASWPAPAGTRAIAVDGSQVWIGGDAGLFTIDASGTSSIAPVAVRDLAISNGLVYLATANGIERWSIAEQRMLAPVQIEDRDVRALAVSPAGVLAACATGLARISGDAASIEPAGLDALPADDLTAVAASGSVAMIGHSI